MSFVWNSNSQHSTVCSFHILPIILFLHSIPMFLCLFAYILRLNALQCSLVGQLLPSPQAQCLCVLSVLLCCQSRRLVIQSGWRGVVLQIRSMLKELLLHAAPYVAWDWLPAYRHRIFASFPPFLPLSLYLFCTLPQTRPISESLCELSELHTYFLPLSNCFSFCSHPAILNKCPVKLCFYLALEAGDINECSLLYLLPVQSIISVLYSHIQKT